jgi:hypothetical protein
VLTNGRTAKNVRGLCELLSGNDVSDVRAAIHSIAGLPKRSLKRRLGYLRWLLANR